MSLLNEASFLVTPNGYKASTLYAAIPVPVEIAVNGNFLTDTNWTKGAGWTIANGFATAIGNSGDLQQSFSFTNNATYTVKYTITDYTVGSIRIILYGDGFHSLGTTRTANGVYTESLTISTVGGSFTNKLYLQTITTNESFKISNVSVKLDTDMTVTRATTATRVDENDLVSSVASNIPRIDYTGGGCPSILLEPLRTNLLLRSQENDNASWLKNNVSVTANALTAPDGTLTADLVTVTSDVGNRLNQAVTVTANTKYTFSFYAKAGTLETSSYSVYDLTNSANVLKVAYEMTEEWQRITSTFTTPVGCTSINIYTTRGQIESGTYYVWGAQLEAGTYPTSYIPTVALAVARNADVISKTGISDLIGQTEGVMFIESAALFNDLTQRTIAISDGTSNNRLYLFYSTTSNVISIFGTASGTSFPLGVSYTISDETQFAKIAVRYRANDITLWVNGVKRGTDITSQALPIDLSRFGFDSGSGGSVMYAKVKQVQLYKTYLTNPEMASLTTL